MRDFKVFIFYSPFALLLRWYLQCVTTASFTINCNPLFGAFAKSRELTISFMSLCLNGTARLPIDGFSQNFILDNFFFEKTVDKIQVSLQSDQNNRYFTTRSINIFFNHISLSSSKKEKCVRQKLWTKSKHTFCVQ